MVKGWIALSSLAVFFTAGCGSSNDGATAIETKPSDVKQNIDRATQDKISNDLKTWKPTK